MENRFVGAMSVLLLSSLAAAQDVDVPNNLTMRDSTDATVGNVFKEGVPFIHNFGTNNTFLGSGAGNFTMSGVNNTASGSGALSSNTTGSRNTATGGDVLFSNTTGEENTANGFRALRTNTIGYDNTAIGSWALFNNTVGSNNTATGAGALFNNTTGFSNVAGGDALTYNTTGSRNTAIGSAALFRNSTGWYNTAAGWGALHGTTGDFNTAIGAEALYAIAIGNGITAIGAGANVGSGSNLANATAIGYQAYVDVSNKVRLGNGLVTVIEGQVPFTYTSDCNQKENFLPVDGEEVLDKIRGLSLTSWNFIGHDPKQFRHYGPMAQDFFAAFGNDGIGTIGTDTTITSGDLDGILMVATQALEKRTVEQKKKIDALTVENADLKARLEALERRVAGYVLTRAE